MAHGQPRPPLLRSGDRVHYDGGEPFGLLDSLPADVHATAHEWERHVTGE